MCATTFGQFTHRWLLCDFRVLKKQQSNEDRPGEPTPAAGTLSFVYVTPNRFTTMPYSTLSSGPLFRFLLNPSSYLLGFVQKTSMLETTLKFLIFFLLRFGFFSHTWETEIFQLLDGLTKKIFCLIIKLYRFIVTAVAAVSRPTVFLFCNWPMTNFTTASPL